MANKALLVAPGDTYATMLQSRYIPLRFSPINIDRLNAKLISKGWEVVSLQNEEATKGNIENFLERTQTLSANEEVLFYFSGHGARSAGAGINENGEPNDEFLVLYDPALQTSDPTQSPEPFSLKDNDITDLVREHLSRGIAFNLILDCCFSGGMIDNIASLLKDESLFTFFAGSTEERPSLFSRIRNISFFTEAILTASNCSTTLGQLKDFTEHYLLQLYPPQRCQINFSDNNRGKASFM
jgi:hypothetical protein